MSYIRQARSSFDKPTLLTLPREIRDLIYISVLQSPNDPPSSPQSTGPRITKHYHRIQYPVPSRPQNASAGLVGCNRQIRSEIREVIQRKAAILDCKLDFMIRDLDVWPTWVLFPGPTKRIRKWDVNIRVFDAAESADQFCGSSGPALLFAPLLKLLNEFFHHGPQFFYKEPLNAAIHVDTLYVTISLDKSEADSPWDLLVQKRIFANVSTELSDIASKGALTGKVDTIRLFTCMDGREVCKEIEVGNVELSQELASYWASCGPWDSFPLEC
ncbi:hypothetical protein MMC28_007286 [Mycoblastus sanguinarius]|nr:hypothetical protein [Mycoblastus sanguinarius]